MHFDFYFEFIYDRDRRKIPLKFLQEHLDAGETVLSLAKNYNINQHALYNLVRKQKLNITRPQRGRTLPTATREEIKRLLLETNLRAAEIRERLNLASRCPIYYLRNKLLKDEIREAGEFHPVVVKKQIDRRCPKHGKVTVWPCVMCAAEEFRHASRQQSSLVK